MKVLLPKYLFCCLQRIVDDLLKSPHERLFRIEGWCVSICLFFGSDRLLNAEYHRMISTFQYDDIFTPTSNLDNKSEIFSTTKSRSGSWAKMKGDLTLFSEIEMAWSTV